MAVYQVKTIVSLLFLLSASLATAEADPPGLEGGNPFPLPSKQSCVEQCEAVFADCREQCRDTKARAHEEHFDVPDVPVGDCIGDCEESARFCKEDC